MIRMMTLRAYFQPEIASSSHLADDMHKAYVSHDIVNVNYTPMPSRGVSDEVRRAYKKKKHEVLLDGHVEVHRFPMFKEGKNPILRAFRYFCCGIAEYHLGVRAKDIDLVHCGSTPPTQGMLCGMVAGRLSKKYKRHVPFVFNLQDIFPDSLVNAGMTHKGSLLWKIGRKIEDYAYSHADKIIVISEGFKRNIMEKGVPEEKIVIVPNWVDLDNIRPVAPEDNRLFEELGIDRSKYTVCYAGNTGEAQGADIILKAAGLLKDKTDIQFVIFGGGACFDEIRSEAKKLGNVQVFGLMPPERVSEVYSLGSAALITCKKGTSGAGFPSKTWSIMACSTPIIASFDRDSELSRTLDEAKAGICVEPEDAKALANAVYSFYRDGAVSDARQYALEHADKNVCSKRYLDVLTDSVKKG